MTQDEQKELVANFAIDTLIEQKAIFNGMKIGLGTGSTATFAVKRLAFYVKENKLKDIKAVATSIGTQNLCEELDIPIYSMDSRAIQGRLDLVIDGADEVDPCNNLVKGGGAALLQEKIAAYNAKSYSVIVDESKLAKTLGTRFPIPVEVVKGAATVVSIALKRLGASCKIRQGVKKCGPVVTDNGNLILDCLWQTAIEPCMMEQKVKDITGVVEVGLFCKTRPQVFVAKKDGSVQVIDCKKDI